MDPPTPNLTATHSHITPTQRHTALGHAGATLWFTGLSGSGKTTIAYATEAALIQRGIAAYVLDGDNLRHGLNRDLGFTPTDRTENIRRAGETARLLTDAGIITLATFISPYTADRQHVRTIHTHHHFLEIYIDTPLDICEQRDPKGLYTRARNGTIPNFTGITAPYEPPQHPDLHLTTTNTTIQTCVNNILTELHTRQITR